jgi:prepilin-type processing-associated H-X9-DG protein/prepilin-type N-terminal cleavage/methylation domain-containing protein
MCGRQTYATHRTGFSSPIELLRTRPGGPSQVRQAVEHASRVTPPTAFTLIELLVVISVITVLMAVLLPALSRARKQAKAVVCQANLRQYSIAYSAYIGDHEGRLIDAEADWCVHLRVYRSDPNETPACPATPRPAPTGLEGQVRGNTAYWSTTGGYGHNRYLQGKTYDRLTAWSRIPTLFDSNLDSVLPQHTDPPPEYEDDAWMTRGIREEMKMVCINRHSGRINVLFLDWSVRPAGLKELWTLKWYSHFDTAGPWTKAGGVQSESWPAWMRKFKDY